MKHSERFSLEGQVALVLGGSSGIGRSIALGFHDAGATVVPVGKTADKVAAVDAALAAAGATAKGCCADVTDSGALSAVIARVLAEHGRIDVLVNSQGITMLKPAEDFTRADYDQLIAVNLTSVFFACTEAGRHMLARGSGSIVNIASLASHRGFQLSALYTMSKHGVLGLTRTLAAEWATRGGSRQRYLAGVLHDPAQPGEDVADAQGDGDAADADAPLRRDRRAGGGGGVPGGARVGVRHRAEHRGRWRVPRGGVGLGRSERISP
jgi:NAD(P)-dependent dehydrogenase (short-subunit alcohol dehydrogenase family)